MEIRAAGWSDLSRVHALLTRAGMSPPSEARWIALWKENPAYRPDVPIGWVLESEGGIVGFIGNLPRLMWDGRRAIIARIPTSWVVEPGARAHSVPLLFQWLNQPGADLLLNTTANLDAAALFDRMRVARVPCRALGERSLWIVSWSAWAAGLLRRAGLGAVSFLGALATPFDVARRIASPPGAPDLQWRTEFGPEFDALWTGLASRPLLQSMRDAANLRWAYGDAVRAGRAWLLAGGEPGAPRGYAVFVRTDIQSMKLSRMRLVDFAALDDDPGPYVRAALARCRRDGVHVLETAGFEGPVYRGLTRLRPLRLTNPGWPAFWRTGDAPLASLLASASGWYPTLYDGDSSLW